MNHRCAFLICLAAVLVLASCSIEKRRYMRGYHVEWFGGSKQPGQVSLETESISIAPRDSAMSSNEFAFDFASAQSITSATDDTLIDASVNPDLMRSRRKAVRETVNNASALCLAQHSNNAPKPHAKAVTSFSMGALSMVFLVLLFAFNVSNIALGVALLVLVLACAILAIRIGGSFRYQYKNARNSVKGNGLANTGIMLGWLAITMLVGFAILLGGIVVVFNVILAAL